MIFPSSYNLNKDQENNQLNVADLIAPAALKIEPGFFQLERKYGRTLFVFNYPRFLNIGWLTPLITLDREMNISLFIYPVETELILKKLRKKVAEIKSQMQMEEEKGKVRSPVLETALEDIEKIRDQLVRGVERLFKLGLYVTFYAESLKELEEIETEIRSLLETKMIYVKPATFQQEQGLVTSLPLGEDQLYVPHNFTTGPLSTLFPFVSVDLTDNKGVLYGINRHNNSLILFDRFSLENANMVVFGKSGGGKSYAIKLETLRSLMLGTDVIIIDLEKEYKYLAETVGGSFIDISLRSPHHINPFDLPIPQPDEDPASVLRSNIAVLTGLLKIMLGDLTPEEEAIIDKALIETYASRGITPLSDFTKVTPPTMKDLYTVLRNIKGAESLGVRLERYVFGTYAGFVNQPTNVSLDKNLVVFSLRDLEEELRPVAMYMILHYLWNIVKSKRKKRLAVVDEAWWIMKHKEGAEFMLSIAKRARKYWLGLTTITQDIPDFLGSPYGLPILANSSLQLLMKQSPTAIDLVAKTFNLTQEEKYMLLECNVGEGLFFAGLKHAAIKVVASYTEDQIITSDPAQLAEIEKAKKELAQEEKQKENNEFTHY